MIYHICPPPVYDSIGRSTGFPACACSVKGMLKDTCWDNVRIHRLPKVVLPPICTSISTTIGRLLASMLPPSSVTGQLVTATISDLPPEILSSIFHFNTSVDLFYGPDHVKMLQDTTRYTSQVCRQWRFLVLENPIIWSRIIDFTRGSHQWIEELLKRAADCPLVLVSRYGWLSSDILARELEHVSRLGWYYASFTTETWPLLDKLQQPAPYLEELSLRGNGNGRCKLTATIFGGHAPRLRRLWLQSCSFDDDLPYLPQLTHLCVSHIPMRNAANFPPKKWLDILPSMPSLTVLELDGVNIRTDPHAAVHLPDLAKITMTASLRESSAFLSCLILPPTCGMRVTAQNARPVAGFHVIAGIIVQKLHFYLAKAIESEHRLYIHFSNDFLIISNRVISQTGVPMEPKTPPHIFFRIFWDTLESGLLSILPHVSSAFAGPLSQVTSLELCLSPALTSKTHTAVASVLRQANKVTSLVRMGGSTAKIFVQLATGRLASSQAEADVIFPALRTIHLNELGTQPHAGADHALQSLVDFVRYRTSMAAPIEEIYYATLSSVCWLRDLKYLKETGVLVTKRDWF